MAFVDPFGLWMDGDEKLSTGAQIYTTYYGEQWEFSHQKYLEATTDSERAVAQAEMDKWHALANDIRNMDSSGNVSGMILNVPIYNQLNTNPKDDTNSLCWATCQAMMSSYYLGDEIDRTQSIASYTRAYIKYFTGTPITYNYPLEWVSSNQLYLELPQSQTEFFGTLSVSQIKSAIDSGTPFGVLYRDCNSGHWILGIGYSIAPGHDSLIVSNNPWGGVQNTQTYNDFQTLPDGRIWTYTAL